MMNIEQITSRLAKLPDQQLQQYAMMHKSDPYIVSLALSESNRRKQMRASAQGGQGMQEQPKVVDQAVAGMAPQQSPDEAGIASLPAGDMNFADGGIVAFAEGGTPYETPYDRMNRETRESAAKPPQSELDSLMAARARYVQAGSDTSGIDQAIATLRTKNELPQANYSNEGRAAVVAPYSNEGRRTAMAGVSPTTAPEAKPKAEAGLGGTKEAAALRGAGMPVAGTGGPSVESAKEAAGKFLDTKSLRGDLDKFYADEKASVEDARKRRNDGKPEGKAYSEYEKLLQAEAAGADKEKGEAQGVAIFKAGLAMMAGASPNAFANIGTGAMVGLEEYSGAMKDMKKAAKERQKAMGEIEQARRAESRDDWKTAQSFEEKADARMAKAREFGVKGIMDLTGKDAELSAGIYKTQVEQKGRMDVAQLQANTTLTAANTKAAGSESKEIAAAEAAIARDPRAKAHMETIKAYAMQPKNPNAVAAMNSLNQLRESTYKQFGITLAGAPGAASPGGNTRMRFDAQGNPIK